MKKPEEMTDEELALELEETVMVELGIASGGAKFQYEAARRLRNRGHVAGDEEREAIIRRLGMADGELRGHRQLWYPAIRDAIGFIRTRCAPVVKRTEEEETRLRDQAEHHRKIALTYIIEIAKAHKGIRRLKRALANAKANRPAMDVKMGDVLTGLWIASNAAKNMRSEEIHRACVNAAEFIRSHHEGTVTTTALADPALVRAAEDCEANANAARAQGHDWRGWPAEEWEARAKAIRERIGGER